MTHALVFQIESSFGTDVFFRERITILLREKLFGTKKIFPTGNGVAPASMSGRRVRAEVPFLPC